MRFFRVVISALILMSCSPKEQEEIETAIEPTVELEVPPHFPPYHIPDDNRLTDSRITLGKKLFFEKQLSKDGQVSCASCHKQTAGFADTVAVSKGVFGRTGTRNAPSVYNMVFSPYFFAEGGVPTLEMQALAPIGDENEMGMQIVDVVGRLHKLSDYNELSLKAYNQNLSPYVITRALAAYQRSLLSVNSKYDDYLIGNSTALNQKELRGLALFESDSLACASCHTPPLFTNFKFYNIGLYATYADKGRYRITLNDEDKGKFKTPSLRNVALSAPYMHDGSLSTLAEVIQHFVNGGKQHVNQDTLIKGFTLNPSDKDALVAFLKTLTDNDQN